MSTVLQILVGLAMLSIVALVACLIPVLVQAQRRLDRLAEMAEQLKTSVDELVRDSHEMVLNLNEVSKRAGRQMEEVDKIVQTAQGWTDRADRLVDEVASAIEPPVHAVVRNINLLRSGVNGFLQALFHRTSCRQEQQKQEEDHYV